MSDGILNCAASLPSESVTRAEPNALVVSLKSDQKLFTPAASLEVNVEYVNARQ